MRRGGWFVGTVLVFVGLVFLAANFGLLPADAWNVIWPGVLILLGIWIAFGSVVHPKGPPASQVTVPLAGATRGRVTIRHGAGRLNVGAGAAPGELLTGSFAGGLDHRERSADGELTSELRVSEQAGWSWAPGSSMFPLDWDVRLNSEVPIKLMAYVGANETTLDLSRLKVTELVLQTGASSSTVTLPESAVHTAVSVKTGAASVRLRVPQGVAARIKSTSGLATVEVDERRFPRTAGGWESPDFASAANRADIAIEVGVGSVQVS